MLTVTNPGDSGRLRSGIPARACSMSCDDHGGLQARHRCRLGQGELAEGAPVAADLGRRSHPIGALTQMNLVQIKLQDLILGKLMLDLQRNKYLTDFT